MFLPLTLKNLFKLIFLLKLFKDHLSIVCVSEPRILFSWFRNTIKESLFHVISVKNSFFKKSIIFTLVKTNKINKIIFRDIIERLFDIKRTFYLFRYDMMII